MGDCKHQNWYSSVSIAQIEDKPGVCHVSLKIHCQDCGVKLQFPNLPLGCSFYQPTVSLDGYDVAIPAVLDGVSMPEGIVSMIGGVINKFPTN
ncbi:MAG TPA: hypothetical protein PKX38_09525 [Alphaproteobacteria bacterium]|nr:hypothetical protein [Alphaproteobacteria bacterium]